MTFKQSVIRTFDCIKKEQFSVALPNMLPIYNKKGELIAFLRPITASVLNNNQEIKLLAKWRKDNSFAFPSQFKVTSAGTKKWLMNQLISNPTRILFFVETFQPRPKLIGHLGLYSFNFKEKSCEIDNVVRGNKQVLKGVMTWAMYVLIEWTRNTLKPRHLYLRVFLDNSHAIAFYKLCGFKPLQKIPLKKIESPDSTVWHEDTKLRNAEKYFLKMVYRGN